MKNRYAITITGNDTFKTTRIVSAFNLSEAVEQVETALAPLTIEQFVKLEARLIPTR